MPTIHVYMEDADKKAIIALAKKHNRAVSRQALHYILRGIEREEEDDSQDK